MAGIVYGCGLFGLEEDARRLFERFSRRAENYSVGPSEWIAAYLGIGDADAAYEWLGRAVKVVRRGEPDPGYITFHIFEQNVHDDPVLDEPRYRELFDQIDAIARSR